MIGHITVLDRIDSNTRLKGWSIPGMTADPGFRNFDVPWWVSWKELKVVAGSCVLILAWQHAGGGGATHSGTHWRSPRWPWPRVCPGKKGDISGSHPLLYGAGRCRATSPAPPQSTRWRGRCTYTWGRQRRWWKRAFQTRWLKFRFRGRGNVLLFSPLLSCKSCIRY